jgi:hypothetical protein
MRICPALLVPVLALALSGCEHKVVTAQTPVAPTVAPTLTGDAAHPGQTQGWVDTKLYFGLDSISQTSYPGRGISETQWQAFLDREVTPRFPAGLSVVDVYGQWQRKGASTPGRLRSKMLIIDYPDTQENRDKIETIRSAWKKMTGDQSVLRVTEPVDVSF